MWWLIAVVVVVLGLGVVWWLAGRADPPRKQGGPDEQQPWRDDGKNAGFGSIDGNGLGF